MTAEAYEMVTVPRAELDALRAEVRRLRREVGRSVARARIEADPGPGDAALTCRVVSSRRPGASVGDRLVRFAGDSWQEISGGPSAVGAVDGSAGGASTCWRNRFRRWLTRSPKMTRCPVPTSCTCLLTA